MATPNGDIKAETAESFARDYIEDLFNNNKNLGAFEEETLDLNIKSKYDDIPVEEIAEEEVKADNIATFTLETAASVHEEAEKDSSSSSSEEEEQEVKVPAAEAPLEPGIETFQIEVPAAEAPLEPGIETFQVNGHVEEEFSEVTQNGVPEPNQIEFSAQAHVIENGVPEPGQNEFASQSDVIEPNVTEMRLESEEPVTAVVETQQVTQEEEEEADDVVAPIPTSRGKPAQTSEEELAEMQFKKLGLTKNWWDSKRSETEVQNEDKQPVDKFRTIKQNIRKGNTRSLLARFEKLTE